MRSKAQIKGAKRSLNGYSTPRHGGYALKSKAKLGVTPQAVQIEPRHVSPPVPPGLSEALQAKSQLIAYIGENHSRGALFTVSVNPNLAEDRWLLLVRGVDPVITYFAGLQVLYMPSSLVRNPRVKI